MITKNTFISAILTILAAAGGNSLHAQDTIKTFVPIINYTADLVVNTHGGIKTGAVYQGYGEAGVEINPWKNGQFNFTIATTHGGQPTETLVGDWQVFDNIEAGNHVFALNAWYSHTVNKVTVKAGLQDVNDSYSTCDAAGNMLNTSFGGNQVATSQQCRVMGWASMPSGKSATHSHGKPASLTVASSTWTTATDLT